MIKLLFGWQGRIGRGSWWLLQLIAIPVMVVGGSSFFAGTVVLDNPAGTITVSSGLGLAIFCVALITSLWVNVVSCIKRFHDRGKSGLWFLMSFVPVIGGIWMFVECGFCSGDDDDNRFGPPRGKVSDTGMTSNSYAASNGKLAKLDDDFFRNYAAAQAVKVSEPAVQPNYVSPAPTISPGGARPAFGKR